MEGTSLFWMAITGLAFAAMAATIVLGMVRDELAQEERRRACGEELRRSDERARRT